MGWLVAGGMDENEKLDLELARGVLRRTLRMVKPYRRRGITALVLLVLFALTSLAGPLLVRRAIDGGLSVGNRRVLNESIIGYVIVAIIAYAAFRLAIATLATVGEGFLRDLRNRIFGRMLSQSMPFYDRENAGVLVSRMSSDVDSLQILVQMLSLIHI